jgi:hypothetical protein
VETFLTLIIALGGIATGIGAIWAALAVRRRSGNAKRSLPNGAWPSKAGSSGSRTQRSGKSEAKFAGNARWAAPLVQEYIPAPILLRSV